MAGGLACCGAAHSGPGAGGRTGALVHTQLLLWRQRLTALFAPPLPWLLLQEYIRPWDVSRAHHISRAGPAACPLGSPPPGGRTPMPCLARTSELSLCLNRCCYALYLALKAWFDQVFSYGLVNGQKTLTIKVPVVLASTLQVNGAGRSFGQGLG